MKNSVRYSLITAASLTLAVSAWGLPRNLGNSATHSRVAQAQAPHTQSVTGTIASVEKTSFTINVTSQGRSASGHSEAMQTNNPKTMSFQIDKNTTIDGTLKVGSNADVTYRQDDSGNNVAISVRVTS